MAEKDKASLDALVSGLLLAEGSTDGAQHYAMAYLTHMQMWLRDSG